ncbi:putative aldouronate transport system permease protein [Paenibacillus sp. BK033]|uniref:ABC transporter permease n=1 Tax=Paenibacillus sp. BK033 TaxID=2512133 RepID=UPI001053F8A5|nr:ABC transporter permease subunit [Paenibacillus sp. BK033]TCN01255.1 putative aldouronate transport system permease protein [Paenibacillus sp. BK033]
MPSIAPTLAEPAAKVRRKSVWNEIKKNRYSYLFILPGMIFLFVFMYYPMYGVTLAFKEYMINKGIMHSPWVGFRNFSTLQEDPLFWDAFWNTFRMGFWYIATGFPATIILALLINELGARRYKRLLQTIYTFPNFLSWVIVAGVMLNFLSTEGVINQILHLFGSPGYEFLADSSLTRPLMYITSIWKGAGWGAIIYLAAIAGINPEQYEVAEIDGANRYQKMWYITWPGIKSTAVILLILAFGGIMNGAFDQILNLTNPITQDAAEVLDTYIYRVTFNSSIFDYGFSTAMGLFKSAINFIFLILANKIAKMLGEGGIM